MTTKFTATIPFDRRIHHVDTFICGEEALDRWLRSYASQSQRRDAARTFVTANVEGNVVGYYTLVASQVEHEQATADVRRSLSKHYPVPVALIARLAVATPYQGAGLGRSLLLDALQRVLRASEELAIRAVTVDAMGDNAAAFYRTFGFEPSPLAPETLMLSPQTIKRVIA